MKHKNILMQFTLIILKYSTVPKTNNSVNKKVSVCFLWLAWCVRQPLAQSVRPSQDTVHIFSPEGLRQVYKQILVL